MIINIASFGGRTHMLDTARELEKCGHIVRFYSYVPLNRAVKFGLKPQCLYSTLWFSLPFIFLFKLLGWGGKVTLVYFKYCDWLLSYYMKPCDVFIGQSPMHNRCLKRMKKKYNAITILERGTSHVLEFIENQKTSPQYLHQEIMCDEAIRWDISAYNLPDFISVGAEHVRRSFVKHGYNEKKIFVNNYGCNLSFFQPTQLVADTDCYDVIQVGTWSYRKGADLIKTVFENSSLRFLHVGSLSIPFPDSPNMKHVDAVHESQLIQYYKKAKVFIMPSREEGLAQTQVQALICGLPIVCSEHSGGSDLRKYLLNEKWIIEMKSYTAESLASCINEALEMANTQHGVRYICDMKHIKDASWEGYGARYNKFLEQILVTNN